MDTVNGFDGLNVEEIIELKELSKELVNDAIKLDPDDMTRQLVISNYGFHWLIIYYKTVDDIIEDSWSITITKIHHMIVDKVMEDTLCNSNITPLLIEDAKGKMWLAADDQEEEETNE